MSLQLYNSLTNKQEDFKPLHPPLVTMYNCGPTVYNYAHIGNLRSFVFADMLRRALELNGYTVTQVINITDVGHLTHNDSGEDKIEKAAHQKGISAKDITSFYTDSFFADLEDLNINRSLIQFPRASDYIQQQIQLIQKLEEKNVAYTTSDGVYFDISKNENYPQLGSIDTHQLQEGVRVEANAEKRNPGDFALWKLSPQNGTRLQEWGSPWGVGFPGWHIECSSLIKACLDDQIDIHTGGVDLQFPHHANEIAQSQTITKKPLARYWLHSEHVQIHGAKMAKSDGNIITLSDLKKTYSIHPIVYRYWLLTAHYRSRISFDKNTVTGVGTALQRLAQFIQNLPTNGQPDPNYQSRFIQSLNNDLATPDIIAGIWDAHNDDTLSPEVQRATIETGLSMLGIDLSVIQSSSLEIDNLPPEIIDLLHEREKARSHNDFSKADTLRDTIQHKGYIITDTSDGPRVYKSDAY